MLGSELVGVLSTAPLVQKSIKTQRGSNVMPAFRVSYMSCVKQSSSY